MIVVSDTSAITNLIAIRRDDLLARLFGDVVIPPAVERELQRTHDQLPPFVRVVPLLEPDRLRDLAGEDLGAGESEAIILAVELGADLLLIDEIEGRRVARQWHLKIIGVLGILARAKAAGLIAAVAPEIEALVREARFWVSEEIRQEVLRNVGEA